MVVLAVQPETFGETLCKVLVSAYGHTDITIEAGSAEHLKACGDADLAEFPVLMSASGPVYGILPVALALRPATETADLSQVIGWIEFIAREFKRPSHALATLNHVLRSRVFFIGATLSLADLALFAASHGHISPECRFLHVLRWFEFMQQLPNLAGALPLLPVTTNIIRLGAVLTGDTAEAAKAAAEEEAAAAAAAAKKARQAAKAKEKQAAPKAEAAPKVEVAKKKEKQKKAPPSKEELERLRAEKAKKKDEEAAKKAAGGGKPKAPVIDPVSRLEIRVGQIVSVKPVDGSDSLYVEQVDVGEAETRTVISGLQKFVPIEEMANRRVVVVCNLQPRMMVGIESRGLVLVATVGDKKVILAPPAEASVGDRVTCQAFPGDYDQTPIASKKKIWDKVNTELRTTSVCVATYKGDPLVTAAGPCRAEGAPDGVVG